MKAHLEELENLVIGQDVLVSYKKLSKHLNVHVNEAKKILPKFTEEISGDTCISETHLLSGKLSEKEGEGFSWHICLVHKADLNDIKKSSIYESSSSHIYAIYQGSSKTSEIIPEFSTRLDELGHDLSGIKNHGVAVSDANGKRKYTAPEAAPSIYKKKPAETSKSKVEEKALPKQSSSEEKQKEEKKEDEIKPENKSEKANTKQTNNKNTKTKGGIANFFQRGAASSAPKQEPKPAPVKKAEVKVEEVEEKPTVEPETKLNSKQVKENGKAKPATGKAAAKRKTAKSQNNSGADKKRKRIMIESDSEESNEEEVMEIEDVDEPAPPTAAAVKEEVEEPIENGICRERKLVDKVFKDEKGFIVTKKTWVTTETKEEPQEKKEVAKVAKKDEKKEEIAAPASAPAKKKQADIMSFFSRR